MRNKKYVTKNLITNIKARAKNKFCYSLAMDEFKKYQEFSKEIQEQKNFGHRHYVLDEIENTILELIEDSPQILVIQDMEGRNIGMMAVECRLLKVVNRALDDETESTQQDDFGMNIGMHCADCGLEELTLKALDNEIASIQQCKKLKWNIGMYGAFHNLEKASLKALDNKVASKQVDKICKMTIGMHCADNALEKATIKALSNEETRFMQDNTGWNLGMYAVNRNMMVATEIAVQYDELRNQKTANGKHMYVLAFQKQNLALCDKINFLNIGKEEPIDYFSEENKQLLEEMIESIDEKEMEM